VTKGQLPASAAVWRNFLTGADGRDSRGARHSSTIRTREGFPVRAHTSDTESTGTTVDGITARFIITGSIATDHLSTFAGSFVDQIIPESLDRLSLSFLVNSLDVRRGGVAANICYGLAGVGLSPVLVGAVGGDFADYDAWLTRAGVDTRSVHVSRRYHTARFVCTTDINGNQIATFYSGAMAEARDIELTPIVRRVGGCDLVLVSPNDPDAMLHHADECRQLGYPFAADPSQQLAALSGEQIRGLITGARYLFVNEYESSLILHKTGWTAGDVLERVGSWITTLGPDGARIESRHHATVTVPALTVDHVADPTGVGDAFRAGYLAALAWRLTPEQAAQTGCAMAALALESIGSQEYQIHSGRLVDRLRGRYGDPIARAVADRLRPHEPATAAA
jgi:adenosine kinase